jgi:hypothetical protein
LAAFATHEYLAEKRLGLESMADHLNLGGSAAQGSDLKSAADWNEALRVPDERPPPLRFQSGRSRFSMSWRCHARISLVSHATRLGEVGIEAGKRRALTSRQSVCRDHPVIFITVSAERKQSRLGCRLSPVSTCVRSIFNSSVAAFVKEF